MTTNRWSRGAVLALLALGASVVAQAQTLETLKHFRNRSGAPNALLAGTDGLVYGTTQADGAFGLGSVFRVDAQGGITTLHSFDGSDGAAPSALTQGSDGAFYGATASGGPGGKGTVFRVTPQGSFTSLHSFSGADGAGPSRLTEGSDGAFYGTTAFGGTGDNGTVFKVSTLGTFAGLHAFSGADGFRPSALTLGTGGALYGTTYNGGANGNHGTIFKVDAQGTFTSLHAFLYSDGEFPSALTLGSDGAVYGTTANGGADSSHDDGTVFKLDAQGTFTSLHSFGIPGPWYPRGALTLGSDGAMYGTTYWGGDGGTVFRVDGQGSFTLLHSFNSSDGFSSSSDLVPGPGGALYGTTRLGGEAGQGTVFKITVQGAFTSLRSFHGSDGAHPDVSLVQAGNGVMYGATPEGGTSGNGPTFGTIFTLDAQGVFTSLHSFELVEDGGQPLAPLVRGSDGTLYGTTTNGGNGQGTVFKVDGQGLLTTLHKFNGEDGAAPETALTVGSDGALYGATPGGGPNGSGTVFRVDPQGTFTSLHAFAGSDGVHPSALIQGSDGAFYGTTRAGGDHDYGTVFKVDAQGSFWSLHSFDGGYEGAYPWSPLIQATDGYLYGTTLDSDPDEGAFFRMDTQGNLEVLSNFQFWETGAYPEAAPVQSNDGSIWIVTAQGGPRSYGTVLRFHPLYGSLEQVSPLDGLTGKYPRSPLVEGADGYLYGTAPEGGLSGYGTVFRVKAGEPIELVHWFYGADGKNPGAGLSRGSDGAFYGTTRLGGTSDAGTLFRIDAQADVTVLFSFQGSDGAEPLAPPTQGSDGNLYGTTYHGGRYGAGTLFKVTGVAAACQADAGPDQEVCATAATTLAGSVPGPGETGRWTVVAGSATFADDTLYNTAVTGLGTGTNMLVWTITRGSCLAESAVRVSNNTPSVAYAGADRFVAFLPTNLVANPPGPGESGFWSVVCGSASFSNQGYFSTQASGLAPGINVLKWTVVKGTCRSEATVTLTYGAPPAGDAGPNQDVCSPSATLAAAAPGPGQSGKWTVVTGSAVFANDTLYNTAVSGLAVGTNTLKWTITSGTCPVSAATVDVKYSALAAASAGGDQEVCSANASLSGSAPGAGETGKWTVVTGSATFADDTLYNTAVTGLGVGANVLKWTITKGTCHSEDTVVVTNNTLTTPNAGSDQERCTASATLAGSAPLSGERGKWTVVSGSAAFADDTAYNSAVSGLAAGVNVLRWTITRGTCTASDTVSVNRLSPTAIQSGPGDASAVFLENRTLTFTVAATGQTLTYEWWIDAGTVLGRGASLDVNPSRMPSLTAGNHLVWVRVTGICGTVTDSAALAILPREVLVSYIGQRLFVTSGANATSAQGTLSASVQDPSGAALSGATITFLDVTDGLPGKVLAAGVPVAPVPNSPTSTGTASKTVSLSTGSFGSESYLIRVVMNGSYSNDRQLAEDKTVAVVATKPASTNETIGSGTVDPTAAAGTFATWAGSSGDDTITYSIGLKYNNKGTNLQGKVTVAIPQADGGIVWVKSNSISSMEVSAGSLPKTSTIYTKASVYKINPDSSMTTIDGNVSLRADVVDAGASGDQAGFTVLSSKGSLLYYSSNWVLEPAKNGGPGTWKTVPLPSLTGSVTIN